jgi:hypothetical protein
MALGIIATIIGLGARILDPAVAVVVIAIGCAIDPFAIAIEIALSVVRTFGTDGCIN